MDTIFAGLGKFILIAVFAAIVYTAGSIGYASLKSVMKSLESGKGTNWSDRKAMLSSIGIDLALMIAMPFLFLIALGVMIDLTAPEIYTTTDTVVELLEDMLVELGSPVDTRYSDKVDEVQVVPTPTQRPYTQPYVQPTQPPQVLVVTATPEWDGVDLNPSMHMTATPVRTLP